MEYVKNVAAGIQPAQNELDPVIGSCEASAPGQAPGSPLEIVAAENPSPETGRGVTPQLENIPLTLREQPHWSVIQLEWNKEKGKYDKYPVSTVTGYGAKCNDPSTWGSFDAAQARHGDGTCAVAYALPADKPVDTGVVVIDIDHCITDGIISEPAQQIVNLFAGTYIERSVSGDGIHIFVCGTTGMNGQKTLAVGGAALGIEVYSSKRFIAMTGDLIEGGSCSVLQMQEQLTALDDMRLAVPATIPLRLKVPARSCTRIDSLAAALRLLDPSEYAQWFRYGIALKRWGVEQNMEESAWTLFDSWSKTTRKSNYSEEANRDQWDVWDTTSSDDPITISSIFGAAKQAGLDMRTVSSPENGGKGGRPAAPAHADVAAGLFDCLLDPSGIPRLRKMPSGWFQYSDSGWEHRPEREIKQIVVTLMQQRKDFCPHGSTSFVNAVLLQLSSHNFCGTEAPLGSWIPSGAKIEPADHWMAFGNNSAVNVLRLAELLAGKCQHDADLEGVLRAKSAAFFSKNFVPYSFDPQATSAPEFFAYLNRIMPDRDDQRMLQQLAGLVLSDLTHYEKMFFLTGSGANGKSVFADILTRLVGTQNVCNLELRQLAERYLSWPLTENKLNISHDLTFANSTAMSKVEGVLKQVVSGQFMNVERKYQDTFAGKCRARAVFITNALPAFSDQSDAIFRRTVIIPFLENIPIEEQDQKMAQRIIENEMSAVFNWAITGLADILRDGIFESPRSVAIKKRHFASCNREREFIQSRCTIDAEGFVASNELYRGYRRWCMEERGVPVGLSAFFSTLVTLYPSVIWSQKQVCGVRRRGFGGIHYHPETLEESTELLTSVSSQQGGSEEIE